MESAQYGVQSTEYEGLYELEAGFRLDCPAQAAPEVVVGSEAAGAVGEGRA